MNSQHFRRLHFPIWIHLKIIIGLLFLSGCFGPAAANARSIAWRPTASAWYLLWSDEFDGSSGSTVNNANWSFDIGGSGWGNNEKQYYTNSPENIALNGSGQLVVTATLAPSGLTCYYGACRYTSAKIKTKGKVEPFYGRIEASLKLPAGQGLWPAFWMLGNNYPATSWPSSGEIDIMEYRGSMSTTVSSALHGPGYSGATPFVYSYTLPSGNFTEDFHLFAVEWEPDQIRYYVDEAAYYTVTKTAVQAYGPWVFDHPFFIILNMAVGGNYDGDPASDSIFPAAMMVDYVRIYARSAVYLPEVIR